RQAAEKLRDLGGDPSGNAYQAAWYLARCIRIVQNDDQEKEERARQAAAYGDEAMKMLRVAVAKGYQDATQMKQDKALDALREREDFKKLLAELEAKKK